MAIASRRRSAMVTFSTRTAIGSLVAVVVSVLANLTFYFAPTNFFRTAAMISVMMIGFVMMGRSLRDLGSA